MDPRLESVGPMSIVLARGCWERRRCVDGLRILIQDPTMKRKENLRFALDGLVQIDSVNIGLPGRRAARS